jgi:hypothetical protein
VLAEQGSTNLFDGSSQENVSKWDREATREASPKTRGLSWGPPPTTAIKEVSAGEPDESVALGVGLQAAALAGALRQPKMGTNRPLPLGKKFRAACHIVMPL